MLLVAGLGLTMLGAPSYSFASESNKAAAEGLFNEARGLMAAGRYEEAIPKLQASQKLDPGLGTLLNLAECYERSGKTASAWAHYREVAARARQAGATERAAYAEQKSRELEPQVSKVVISVATNAAGDAALTVRRNGQEVDAAELGVAIPMDPGSHVFEASAPGKQPFSVSVDVAANGETKAVEIPVLADEAAPAAVPVSEPTAVVDAGTMKGGSTQRTAGLIVGGVGVVGVGLGTFFGIKAAGSWADAKDGCRDFPYGCSGESQSLEEDARTQGTLSTVSFIVGGVGLAAGAVLFFTAPSAKEDVALRVGPSGLALEGTF